MKFSRVIKSSMRVVVSVEPTFPEAAFCRGVLSAARQLQAALVFLGDRSRMLAELRAARSAKFKDVGLICSAREFALMAEVGKRKLPYVVWGDGAVESWEPDATKPMSICAVDNAAIGRMAATHFLRSGAFRSFVYADSRAEDSRDWWAQTRGQSFAETVGFARCVSVTRLSLPELPRPQALAAVAERLRALPGPVAVFACSVRLARNLMNLCRAYALRVPADVAILGVEGGELGYDAAHEEISTVRLDLEQQGACAWRLLRALQGGSAGRKELIRPLEVIERDSTRVRPTENPFVNRAHAFIATAPLSELTSQAVVAHCGTSKSYLAHWFRELTGRSILDTIHDRVLSEVRDQLLTSPKSIREIAEYFGKELKSPAGINFWCPDGYKDEPSDRLGPRQRMADSLDKIFKYKYNRKTCVPFLESKLFGIGLESYTVNSHEFVMGYAMKRGILALLDMGHFHISENVADKISSFLMTFGKVAFHISRPVRWDSDHVIRQNDDLRAAAQEIVKMGPENFIIALDYFDASINRVAAWVLGMRNMQKELLKAMLTPWKSLAALQDAGEFTAQLVLQEEYKGYPAEEIWVEFCKRQGVVAGEEWLKTVQKYEKDVLVKRG